MDIILLKIGLQEPPIDEIVKKSVRRFNTGTFELETGRNRSGTLDSKVVPERQLIITEQLEGHLLNIGNPESV